MITQEEMQEKNAAKYNIPMLEKSFELLEFLVNYPSGLTMQELVNLLDTPKTTIYRLLSSMQGMGYLTKDADTQRFSLSKRFLKLGLAALGESNIVEQSLAPMRALRDTIKESVMLGVFMENRVVLLEQVLGSHNFTFLLRPEQVFACTHRRRQNIFSLSIGRRTRKGYANHPIHSLQQTYDSQRNTDAQRDQPHQKNGVCIRPGRRNGRRSLHRHSDIQSVRDHRGHYLDLRPIRPAG